MARIFDQVLPLSQVSLQPPASFPELYQELWWYSGSYVSGNGTGVVFIQKGTTANVSASTGSAIKLHTLNSTWNPVNKCCLEVALWTNNASYAANAQLYDLTAGSAVSGTQISTTSTTVTVLRSGQVTLTPGHVYGVQIWSGNASGIVYITDASLIIFPPAGSVSPSLSSISLANPSGNTLKEAYIPLWEYSSSTTSVAIATSGTNFIYKGSVGTTGPASVAEKLHALNSSWYPSQKFALEVSMYNGTSGDTANAQLYDFTSSTLVGSSVSVTSTTATVVRSGSFTLTPGHTYGVSIWSNAGTAYLTKAHLVALS